MTEPKQSIWKTLWDYDPNGLVVVDENMRVQVVNQAFCEMFQVDRDGVVGTLAEEILGDVSDFRQAWRKNYVYKGKEQSFPQYSLYVRKVIFPVREEGLVACIVVNLSQDRQRREEIASIKRQSLEQVAAVVDKQMKVAQEIASLLGETTAETKVSLLRLRGMLEEES